MRRLAFRQLALLGVVLAALFASSGSGLAAPPPAQNQPGAESAELMNSLSYFTDQRAAPNGNIAAGAYASAVQQAAALKTAGTTWSEVGPYRYFTDDARYADPTYSNTGSGEEFVSGRIAATAATSDGNVLLAGGADGGVWRSTDQGVTWTPVADHVGTTSIGAIAVDDSTSPCTAYVGTGEANTSSDSYAGIGLLRSTDCGQSFSAFGPSDLVGALVWRIVVDGPRLYVASSHGLWRSANRGATWARVLEPNSDNFTANQITDVVVRPGTGGREVVAAVGWRNGSAYNGLYVSTDSGSTFARLRNPQGWVQQSHEGRVTLAYSSDGSQLYAIDEDPTLLTSRSAVYTVLGGVYASPGGDPNGPWTQIADSAKLMNSGSALKISNVGIGYQPGVQAWYNQFLAVDPRNAEHMYLGLEEVYETRDGGVSWTTVGPYWNLTEPCFSYTGPFEGSCNHRQTHPDQHAAFIAGSTLFVGNDGGMWSRSLGDDTAGDWNDLNANLGTLQFYYAGAGKKPGDSGYTYYGGLQDNGTTKVFPSAQTISFCPGDIAPSCQSITENAAQPFGGDGTNVIVDPANPDDVITAYVYLTEARSTDGGASWHSIAPSDPNPRFVAPARQDKTDPAHLIAAGEYFWDSHDGFNTESGSWHMAFDAGAGHSITAIDTAKGVSYAGWCGPCNPSMANGTTGFGMGMATDYGGQWHSITKGLPDRYVTGVWADANDGAHVVVTLSGYSRRWIASPTDPGVGHVFESHDAGATWTDISGGLPDAPTNDAVITPGGDIVVASDVGAFITKNDGKTWYRLGTNLPDVVINSWAVTPGGDLVAATHGRGLWTYSAANLAKL